MHEIVIEGPRSKLSNKKGYGRGWEDWNRVTSEKKLNNQKTNRRATRIRHNTEIYVKVVGPSEEVGKENNAWNCDRTKK